MEKFLTQGHRIPNPKLSVTLEIIHCTTLLYSLQYLCFLIGLKVALLQFVINCLKEMAHNEISRFTYRPNAFRHSLTRLGEGMAGEWLWIITMEHK